MRATQVYSPASGSIMNIVPGQIYEVVEVMAHSIGGMGPSQRAPHQPSSVLGWADSFPMIRERHPEVARRFCTSVSVWPSSRHFLVGRILGAAGLLWRAPGLASVGRQVAEWSRMPCSEISIWQIQIPRMKTNRDLGRRAALVGRRPTGGGHRTRVCLL